MILVLAVRAALWLWPYDRVRRYFDREGGGSEDRPSSATIVRFISAVNRSIPRGSCLTAAVAAEALLRWHGYDALLRIGVSKNDSNSLQAHAWVESGGEVVIGGDEVEGLTPLHAAGAPPCP